MSLRYSIGINSLVPCLRRPEVNFFLDSVDSKEGQEVKSVIAIVNAVEHKDTQDLICSIEEGRRDNGGAIWVTFTMDAALECPAAIKWLKKRYTLWSSRNGVLRYYLWNRLSNDLVPPEASAIEGIGMLPVQDNKVVCVWQHGVFKSVTGTYDAKHKSLLPSSSPSSIPSSSLSISPNCMESELWEEIGAVAQLDLRLLWTGCMSNDKNGINDVCNFFVVPIANIDELRPNDPHEVTTLAVFDIDDLMLALAMEEPHDAEHPRAHCLRVKPVVVKRSLYPKDDFKERDCYPFSRIFMSNLKTFFYGRARPVTLTEKGYTIYSEPSPVPYSRLHFLFESSVRKSWKSFGLPGDCRLLECWPGQVRCAYFGDVKELEALRNKLVELVFDDKLFQNCSFPSGFKAVTKDGLPRLSVRGPIAGLDMRLEVEFHTSDPMGSYVHPERYDSIRYRLTQLKNHDMASAELRRKIEALLPK